MTTPRSEDDGLVELVAAAEAAATIVQGYYGRPLDVELKGPEDPVTRADREANDLICRALEARFPAAAIIAEESVSSDPQTLAAQVARPEVIFVDPLDGTREFVAGWPEFAVMIGLARRGRPALGVVALPAEGRLLAARVGEGAWSFRPGEFPSRATAVSLRGSRPRTDRLKVVVSRSRPPELPPTVHQVLGPHELQPCGSVGVKVSRLLAGGADLYLHVGRGLKLWDCCGPEAIVLGAGGAVSDWSGAPIAYDQLPLALSHGLVAGPPALCEAVLPGLQAAPQA